MNRDGLAQEGNILAGLIVHAADILATADEVQFFLGIFSQRFCPTDFDETARTLECAIIGLYFQQLTFGRSDVEQEPHSCWTIIHRRAMSLFAKTNIVIHRTL